MANYGPDDGILTYATKDMTNQITTTLPAVEQANETDDFTPLGSAIQRQIYTGLTDYGQIPVGGPFDDTATTGSDAVFGGAARAKTYGALVITWGGAKTTTFSQVGIANYKRAITKGNINGYEAVMFLGPGCTVTEA